MVSVTEFKRSLDIEITSLNAFLQRIKDDLVLEVIDTLNGCRGRVIVIGMGKCGLVGRKIAATFASTGTPAMFLHPAEAIHGDLGFVCEEDVALILSNSGETEEITALLPHLKRMRVKIVALTGRIHSTLAKYSHAVIDTQVAFEADPLNIAPTASTTVMLAVGDALAAALMKKRGFTKEDYAGFHPGGSLGQKLLCQVSQLMHTGKDIPLVHEDMKIREIIFEMTSKRLGATFVVDDDGRLAGVFTDGDLRRLFQRDPHALDLTARAVMSRKPKTITSSILAADALQMMEDNLITILPVLDEDGKPAGALHIHDLIRAGIGG